MYDGPMTPYPDTPRPDPGPHTGPIEVPPPRQSELETALPPVPDQIGIEHHVIQTEHAPAPGNYSQARVVEMGTHAIVYTAGQTGNDPMSDVVVEGGIEPQTRRAIENLRGIMEAAGGSLDDIVKITVFLKDMARDKTGFEAA